MSSKRVEGQNSSRYASDDVDRLVSVTDREGGVEATEYDAAGQVVKVTDATGRATSYGYDAAGQLVSVTEGVVAGGPVDASTNVTTSYAYDAVGNMVGMTDPRGNTTSFEFDLMGHVTGETNALGKTWEYRYDERGLLASERDPLGQRTDYSWRPDARLSRVSYADGAYGEFAYDPEGNQVGMRDRVGITETTLDKEGRPTKVSAPRGGETTKQWDLAGRLEEMVLPTGVAAQYRYDDAGRPESTTLKPVKGSDLVESYSWDAASELVGVSRSNGVMTTIGYDPVGRVGSIEHRIPKVSQPKIASPVKKNAGAEDCDCVDSVGYRRARNTSEPKIAVEQLRFDYAYDKTSNVAEVLKTSGGERLLERFGYDRLSRLTSSTDSTGRTDEYGYDAAGNRTSWRTSDAPDTPVVGDALSVVSSFDAANQLTAASVDRAGGSGSVDIANTYDANGNRVAQDVTPADGSQVSSTGYRFDAADRLTKVTRPGFSEAFTLDGAGRRVATKTSTGVGVSDTETVFDGLDPVAQTGGAAADRTMLGGVEMGSDGSVSWKLTDRAGDVVAVTGADGGVVAMAGYSDFGVTKTTGDWDVLTAHSGELSDPTVGMDLYYRRAYDPLTANWGQADPYRGLIAAPQSLNRYAFVNGNPVTSRDVLGYSADAASHYGSGAQSFFNSQHSAPKTTPRVPHSADSAERWTEDGYYDSGKVPASSSTGGGGGGGRGGGSADSESRIEENQIANALGYLAEINSPAGVKKTGDLNAALEFAKSAAGPSGKLSNRHLEAMRKFYAGDESDDVLQNLPPGMRKAFGIDFEEGNDCGWNPSTWGDCIASAGKWVWKHRRGVLQFAGVAGGVLCTVFTGATATALCIAGGAALAGANIGQSVQDNLAGDKKCWGHFALDVALSVVPAGGSYALRNSKIIVGETSLISESVATSLARTQTRTVNGMVNASYNTASWSSGQVSC